MKDQEVLIALICGPATESFQAFKELVNGPLTARYQSHHADDEDSEYSVFELEKCNLKIFLNKPTKISSDMVNLLIKIVDSDGFIKATTMEEDLQKNSTNIAALIANLTKRCKANSNSQKRYLIESIYSESQDEKYYCLSTRDEKNEQFGKVDEKNLNILKDNLSLLKSYA